MKKFAWSLSILVIGSAIAMAQPPEGPRGGGRGDFRLPPNPLVEALDTDGDGVISADELKAASESLAKLDANKDGKLADDELRPRPPAGDRGPDDRGPGSGPGAGNRGRGGDGRGAEGRGPASGRGGDARGPQGRGGPGRDGGPGGAGGPGGRGADGGRGPEGPGGPPSPERFVEHAMEFDADKDGKLNHDELAKFAQEMIQRRGGGPGGQGGPGGEGRPNGPGNSGGRPESGERPRRPE